MKNSLLFGLCIVAALLFFVPAGHAQQKPVIGVAGISHESNSFSSQPTTLEDFNFTPGVSPEERAKTFFAGANSKTTSSGYIEGAKRFGLELYPALFTRARPMGPVTDEAFVRLVK